MRITTQLRSDGVKTVTVRDGDISIHWEGGDLQQMTEGEWEVLVAHVEAERAAAPTPLTCKHCRGGIRQEEGGYVHEYWKNPENNLPPNGCSTPEPEEPRKTFAEQFAEAVTVQREEEDK